MAKTNIPVKMVGEDGNAFAILGRRHRALRDHRQSGLWDEFYRKATSGDYNNLLATVCEYFNVDADEDDEDELQKQFNEISED